MQTVSTHDRLTSSCQARPLVKFFCVAKVNGDGDCFFHALAYFDGYDGQALRIDMADFLEEQALTQPGFKEEMAPRSNEAARLQVGRSHGHGRLQLDERPKDGCPHAIGGNRSCEGGRAQPCLRAGTR